MKREWKLATSLLGIASILCCGYFLGIPAIVSLPSHKTEIEQKILKESGYKINLGNPKLSMGSFPSVWIKSNNISLLNDDDSVALSIDNPKIKLKLFPLIMKKIDIAKVYSDKEIANLVLDEEKHFYIGKYPLIFNKKENKFTFDKINMDLGQYIINLEDNYTNKKLSLNGEYLKNVRYINNDKFAFSTKGVFSVDNKSTDYYSNIELDLPLMNFSDDKLKLDANIKDFDLSSIGTYVNILSKGYIQDLKGTLAIDANTEEKTSGHKKINLNLNTQDIQIIGKDEPSSIKFANSLNFKTSFETIAGGIKIKNAALVGKDLNISVNGKLKTSGKKIPAMDLYIKALPSRLEQICHILPGLPNLLPEMDLYKLKKYMFYGDGELDMHVIGQGERPEVFGNAKMRNAYLIKKGLIEPEGASVDLGFRGKVMDIDVFVPSSPNQNVTLNGWIKIDGTKYSELDIKSTDSIIMESAQKVLNPLHEIFKFKLGPVPIMKIKGLARIDVKSRGKKVDPHLFGKMYFRNATASFNEINNLELYNGSGEINFNNTEIPFKTYTATINGQPAYIYGKCNVMGNLDVFAKTTNQKIPNIIKVINTSEDMKDVQKVLKPFTKPDGIADLFLNIYGNAKDVEHVEFNKDLFAKGTITLHNATTVLQDTYLPFHNINGAVNFDKKHADYDLSGYIRNSKVKVKGTAEDNYIDLVATSDKFMIADIMDSFQPDTKLPYKNDIGKIEISFSGKYKGIAESGSLDYDKIIVDGKMLSNMNSTNPIKVADGIFNIKNGFLKTNTFKGLFNNNPYTLSFTGYDIYNDMKIKDAVFNMNGFNIASINDIQNQLELPTSYTKQLEMISDLDGIIDIKGYIKNGNIYSDTNLDRINFIYKPLNAKVNILNGKANIRGNTLYLGNINSTVNSMPVYINGNISQFLKSPYLDLFASGKLTQRFLDGTFNNKSVYPIKIKGDVKFTSKLKGNQNKLHTDSTLNIGENSSLYYMGATLSGASTGGVNTDGMPTTNPVFISADADLTPTSAKINNLSYDQIITSQNKKTSVQNQISATGSINLLKDNVIGFKDFKIKTSEPTNARIFNILLKKPTIKQGMFTTDLLINGTSIAPFILGNLNIYNIDIPFWDTTIRDIDLNFQKDYITLNSRGSFLTNDIAFMAKILNKPYPPYVIDNIAIDADALNLNMITEKIDQINTEKLKTKQVTGETSLVFSPEQIIINDGQIKAEKILIKKAEATDFLSNLSLKEDHILNVDDFKFKIANGEVQGKISSNLVNSDMNGYMSIKSADAQIISENFFDMPGQMYGFVTGDLDVACKGSTSLECLKTLSGKGHFDVIDGRMPKLGSLEYLLKAANLVTGGVTGLSINGIIDLITPLKTGNFEKISGDIKVNNGIATDIDVYSSGKELNMYLTGKYDLSTLIADMQVYGSLSKNFSTVLGKIGNLSLNRLLNTIPGININEIKPETTSNINKIPNFNKNNTLRVFKSEIYGDINGSNYVKSFRWIKH